jgi:hypothetical protein
VYMQCRWGGLQWVQPHFWYLFINRLPTEVDVFHKDVYCHYTCQLVQYHCTYTLQVYNIFCPQNMLNSMPQVYLACVSSGSALCEPKFYCAQMLLSQLMAPIMSHCIKIYLCKYYLKLWKLGLLGVKCWNPFLLTRMDVALHSLC